MKQKVVKLLDALGINYRWVDHPAMFTVADSIGLIEDKKPIKNLLLQESKGHRKVLIIMDGNKKLNTKVVEAKLGCRKLQFAKPVILEQTLGVKPGAVSVFGLLFAGASDVDVVIDSELLEAEELGFHPNDNTVTIFIGPEAVRQVVNSTGHKLFLVKL